GVVVKTGDLIEAPEIFPAQVDEGLFVHVVFHTGFRAHTPGITVFVIVDAECGADEWNELSEQEVVIGCEQSAAAPYVTVSDGLANSNFEVGVVEVSEGCIDLGASVIKVVTEGGATAAEGEFPVPGLWL